MGHPYRIIDAFTRRRFGGNPAAVVFLTADMSDPLRQAIAAEFNLSETAFVRKLADGRFDLRWFTPQTEVPLCGHATLAAAHAIWESKAEEKSHPIRFMTRESGELICTRVRSGLIEMDFPATPPEPAPLPKGAAESLGIAGPVVCVGSTAMNLTLRVPSEEQVRACRPNLDQVAAWHPIGVTVTAMGDEPGVDFVSRFFAPRAGIPEDPVTGSAHCALAPYWAAELGRSTLLARQVSARGGELEVAIVAGRVRLRGHAVTIMKGRLDGI